VHLDSNELATHAVELERPVAGPANRACLQTEDSAA